MEALEFGVEKGLFQDKARRIGGLWPQSPNSPMFFREDFFVGKICEEGYRMCDLSLTSWWGGKRVVFQEFNQKPLVPSCLGSLRQCSTRSFHPPPGWGPRSNRYALSLKRNQDPAPELHCYFSTAFLLFSHFLILLTSMCSNLSFETQGRSRKLKAFFPTNKKWTHRLCTWKDSTGSCQDSLL